MKEHRLVRTKYDRSKSITSGPRVETGKTRTPKIKSEASVLLTHAPPVASVVMEHQPISISFVSKAF
jgi:hypothetical protein